MIAPDLIRIEPAAAISRRFRLGDLDAAEAGELCEEWFKAIGEGVVSTVPSALDIADAVRLSLAIRHALQDCFYLALVMRLDAELVTADSTFVARAGTAHHAIRLLAQATRE